ncbi:beta family protein [Sneathiella sp. CAU 1612]|uniref:Beta family protein n=1 Tax=Sneathiella sedimenti TaxID=2816034 RepID=A0ABS3F4Z3_9PROT|nr:beta family protein [Sneathiella sedimenti]MBO0333599.1 beta family protein [Sneathiella sedimenti]
MAFDIGALSYVPTLAIRASEMNGLEKLPSLTKDKMVPIFLLAPWGRSKELDNSISRIEKAFPHRPYFLDLDRDYQVSGELSPAQEEFRSLFSNTERYRNWIDFVSKYEFILPCIQLPEQSTEDLLYQIGSIQALGKLFCIRIELKRIPSNLNDVVMALNAVGSADYVIQIDGGWTNNFQITEAEIHGLITGPLGGIDANIPIIVSCTSIPVDYTVIEGREVLPFGNREMVNSLKRSTNRNIIVYGDWGSTRPRQYGIASPPKPRIDYPIADAWVFARSKENNWDFKKAAEEIVSSPEWETESGLGIWGEQMIMLTKDNPTFGINSAQKNVAARVNIHLHRQALFDDGDIRGIDLDEEWED